jgi:hypothetical protein
MRRRSVGDDVERVIRCSSKEYSRSLNMFGG